MISKDRAREMVIDAALNGWQLWIKTLHYGLKHGILAETNDGALLYMFEWKSAQKSPISIKKPISTEQAFEIIEKAETLEGWNG